MAQLAMCSTPLDCRSWSEHLSPDRISYPRLSVFIHRADARIRSALRSFYTIDTSLLETAPWNGPPQDAYGIGDTVSNAGTAQLSDITVAATAITEMWTLTFTSATAYTITGSLSGSQGTGAVGSNSSSTNAYITIPSINWSGTAVANDVFYVATYTFKPLIVALSSMMAAGYALLSQYEGDNEISAKGNKFLAEAKEIIKSLQTPYAEGGITLDTFADTIDISPEGVQYFIDRMGVDISSYPANEMLDWDDSQTVS